MRRQFNHRSPNGFATDGNGDPQTWGFTGLRSATNANPIVASQALPGTSPFLISGFGQEASNANAKITAIDPGATGITATSGLSWGNYATSTPANLMPFYEAQTGHKWMFIAEGLGQIDVGNVTAAVFTIYINAGWSSAQVFTPPIIVSLIPAPATWSLAGLGVLGHLCCIRRRDCSRNGRI